MYQATSKVEEIFYAALGHESPGDRAAFLDRACGDAELRRRVDRLLALVPESGDFLEAPASAPTVTDSLDPRPAVEAPGAAVGPYKLLEVVGEGGMGVVYMAEQAEPVRRRVALKVIKPGMDSRQVIARFEAERQALAMMDHPNIAKVLDGGVTPSGRPYFVMELVRGLPITDYCDEQHLSIRERLELFVLVCRAVQHAHQKGVIHRDLKPSNVLVTVVDGVAVPKVIDFGVAKATGEALTDKTLFTGFHQFVGTPLYVSPEQAELSGADVDTRSDIYSLGVLLYELLTGTTPFDSETLKKAAFDEMRRIIREVEPPRPSTRLSTLDERLTTVAAQRKADPKRLGITIKGELDWVVMKALEKDRRRRYETANDFAADVMRFLTDRPVEAFPPSAWYRFAKFARRNRVAIALGAVLGAALVMGVVGLAAALYAISREQTRTAAAYKAEARQRQLARQAVDEMYTEVAEKWLSREGKLSPLQRQFLEKALAFYEGFAAEDGDAQRFRPETAKASVRVGEIRHRLGLYEQAVEAHRKALRSYEGLKADAPDNPEYRRGEARAHHAIGHQFEHLGRLKEAERSMREALSLSEKLDVDSPTTDHRTDLGLCLRNLGVILNLTGRPQEAEPALRRCRDLFETLTAEFSDRQYPRIHLAGAEANLAVVVRRLGRNDEAEKHERRALEVRRKLAEEFADDPDCREGLANSYLNLGSFLAGTGRYPEAIEEYRRGIDVAQDLTRKYPDRPEYSHTLTLMLTHLSRCLASTGQREQAEEPARRAVRISEELRTRFPSVPDYREAAARALSHLAILMSQDGRREEVEQAFEKALNEAETLAAKYPGRADYREVVLAPACYALADYYINGPRPEHRDLDRAINVLRRAIEVDPKEGGHWKLLGLAEYRAGRWDEAIRAVEKGLEVCGNPGYVYDWVILALAHARRGEIDRAREWYEKARPAVESGNLADTPGWLVDEAKARLGSVAAPGEQEAEASPPRI